MEYDVTIGIPVYKSADYIRRALESALAQTYSSIEYLVIDDGSGDGEIAGEKELFKWLRALPTEFQCV